MDNQTQDNQNPVNEIPKPSPNESVGPDYWRKSKRSKLIYLVVIAALVITAVAYWVLAKPESANQASHNQAAQTTQPVNLISGSTTHYDSSNFNLGLDYPKDWSLSDTSGSGKLTIISPALQLKNAAGQTVSGRIIMSIRDKTQKLTEFDKGAATAVRDSEKIAYTKPTSTQRGSTYVSFLQYASSNSGSLDGLYITGDNGYQKGQDIPLIDISKSDPVINITFTKCANSKCSDVGTPLSLNQSVWDENNFSKPLRNLLESLSIN